MTCIEFMKQNHPELINDKSLGGVHACIRNHPELAKPLQNCMISQYHHDNVWLVNSICTLCWNQEVHNG